MCRHRFRMQQWPTCKMKFRLPVRLRAPALALDAARRLLCSVTTKPLRREEWMVDTLHFRTASNAETFQVGRGYTMFVRGNVLTTALWDLRGPINSGLINLPVSFTSSGTTADDGWNLVGNPYPSTIDWNAASGWGKNNINATIYIRDNGTGSGQYATWNGVVGTNGGSQYIAAGQAFWVKAGGRRLRCQLMKM